jgi:hypothetical protein
MISSTIWIVSCLVALSYDQQCDVVLSGRITILAMYKSDQQSQRCTVATCSHVMPVLMVSPARTSR